MRFNRLKCKSYTYVQALNYTNTSQICLSLVVLYVTKNFRDFTDRNFNISQVHALAARKARAILGCLSRSEPMHYLQYAAHLMRKQFGVAIRSSVTHRARDGEGPPHAVWPGHISRPLFGSEGHILKGILTNPTVSRWLPVGKSSRNQILCYYAGQWKKFSSFLNWKRKGFPWIFWRSGEEIAPCSLPCNLLC